MAIIPQLATRQSYGYDPDTYDDGWWNSPTAYIVKWVITVVILVAIFSYFIFGYWHARVRMKQGLQPLRYHRCLVSKYQHRQYFPSQHPQYQHVPWGHGQAVPLQSYGPAPPAYHENDYVPAYEPAAGASKIDPDQTYHPPVGPPPNTQASSSTARV